VSVPPAKPDAVAKPTQTVISKTVTETETEPIILDGTPLSTDASQHHASIVLVATLIVSSLF
jgi:hypothetical protein